MLTKTENEIYGEHRIPKRRGSWPRQFTSTSRSIRVVIRACFVLFLILGLRRGLADLHDQYVKREATDFASLRHDDLILQHPGHYVRTLSGSHIGDRYEYIRHLGSGDEGRADLYRDIETETTVVIKTFTGFLRNKIPDAIRSDFSHYTDVWPTELEAGMTLRPIESASNFLLLSDYFILQQTDSEWAWATVSPFSEQGTLVSFAADIKQQGLSAEQLDLIFRPNFDEMLGALATLHAADMCHDDVKPDNIFARSPTAWKLGDLGNMRHVNHAWHSTRSWTRQNQLRDCRDNDERRLIKSYLIFLRNASDDTDDFDDEFWAAETAWSRLYWDFTSSVGLTASKDGYNLPLESLEKRTERELLCTTIPWRLWKPQWFLTFWI